MKIQLSNKTALVTGGGRNLGRAIARSLARAGANVVVNVKSNLSEAEMVVKEIQDSGGNAIAVIADISDLRAVEKMFQHIFKQFGRVDILINNASIRPKQLFLSITPEEWDDVLRTDLSGAFYCSRQALPAMAENGWGRIINISGVDGFIGMGDRAHVVTCKAGLIGLTKALAIEFGQSGITVNAIVPGVLDTTRRKEDYPHWPPSDDWLRQIPIPRLGQPHEVAALCTFLVSEEAEYITGQSIHIDGGLY